MIFYILPQNLRFDFARPRAIIVRGDFTGLISRNAPSLVCVGDVVSHYCARALERLPRSIIMLVDGKTRRSIQTPDLSVGSLPVYHTRNPPGRVAATAARLLCSLIEEGGRAVVMVDGEEDMLALPAIACSRLGGVVVYGVPGRGAALVRVTRWARWDASNRFLLLSPRVERGGPGKPPKE